MLALNEMMWTVEYKSIFISNACLGCVIFLVPFQSFLLFLLLKTKSNYNNNYRLNFLCPVSCSMTHHNTTFLNKMLSNHDSANFCPNSVLHWKWRESLCYILFTVSRLYVKLLHFVFLSLIVDFWICLCLIRQQTKLLKHVYIWVWYPRPSRFSIIKKHP